MIKFWQALVLVLVPVISISVLLRMCQIQKVTIQNKCIRGQNLETEISAIHIDVYKRSVGEFDNKCDFALWPKLLNSSICTRPVRFVVAGMNEGQLADVILRSCPSARVHGFEIQSSVYKRLRQKYRHEPRVHVTNAAVSARSGVLPVVSGGEGGGVWKTFRNQISWNGNSTVASVSVADLLMGKVSVVDFVIFDVEGHEVEAVLGLKLERYRRRFPVIQYELGGTWADSRHTSNWTQADMAEYLQQLGYELYLMGCTSLLQVSPSFFRNARVLNEGYGYFIQGNVLAVLNHQSVQPC